MGAPPTLLLSQAPNPPYLLSSGITDDLHLPLNCRLATAIQRLSGDVAVGRGIPMPALAWRRDKCRSLHAIRRRPTP
jgi:hypothetical protein